jgi:hypothetical protein
MEFLLSDDDGLLNLRHKAECFLDVLLDVLYLFPAFLFIGLPVLRLRRNRFGLLGGDEDQLLPNLFVP